MRLVIHMLLHFAVPAAVARVAYADRFRSAWAIMVATMAVDLDHLLAEPILDANRCSIAFHPLHSYPAIAVYALATAYKPTRLVGLGLLIHMALDGIDCLWMSWLP